MTSESNLAPTDAQVAAMRREVLLSIDTRRRRRRVRWSIAGVGTAVVLAGGTTAAAIYVTSAPIDKLNTSFDCYTSTDLSAAHATTAWADSGYPGAGQSSTALLPVPQRVQQAIDWCTAGWTSIRTGSTKADTVDVPDPTACVLRDGRLAVLPNARAEAADAFCTSLGLSAPVG